MATMPGLTVREETVDDALLAVKLLRAHARIDVTRIFVLGHSLGATLAPRIAADDPGIAGIVIMAGYTRPLPELIIEQTEYLSSLPGAPQQSTEALEKMKDQAKRTMDPALPLDTPKEQLLGAHAAYWKDLNAYKPAEVAAGLKMPILILQGERDYQVTLKDLEGWRKALSGRNNVTIKTYVDLNHIFLPGEGKSTPNEYRIPGRIPANVIDDIHRFISH
jgi:dienelactone hydrolase